ncbi:MAG: aldehyde dehydrogenase family protein, partial [Solirubrobacteraceae bacterium]
MTVDVGRVASRATRLFIAGEWRDAACAKTIPATSPATGENLGPVAQAGREDAGRAVRAAAEAFATWGRETAFARARKLHAIGENCERRREELALALTLDQGKPLHAEAYDEVNELIVMWHAAAEDGLRLDGSIPPSNAPGKRVLLLRRPVGPTAVVTPWNWPYTMPAEIVAPALAAGNTVAW